MLDLSTHIDRRIKVNHYPEGAVLTVQDINTGAAIHAGLKPDEARAVADALAKTTHTKED